jgi:hypothetical protein
MPRMSEVPGWAPLKVFSEDSNYNAEQRKQLELEVEETD